VLIVNFSKTFWQYICLIKTVLMRLDASICTSK